MADKSMGLEKVQFFPVDGVRRIAVEHVSVFSRRVFRNGIDSDGKQLKPYSKKYQDMIASDFRDESGSRLEGYRDVSIESAPRKIAMRNPVLTGKTARNLRVRNVKSDQYSLGWDGEPAQIVQELAGMGRDIAGLGGGDPVPAKEQQFIVERFARLVDKEFRKLKDVKIRVGKK